MNEKPATSCPSAHSPWPVAAALEPDSKSLHETNAGETGCVDEPGDHNESHSNGIQTPHCSPRTKLRHKLQVPWSRLRLKPGLTLVNSGSVARDHLASERTFLAYVRTSLAASSMGVVLVQLFTVSGASPDSLIHTFSRPLGATTIAIGFAVLVLGLVRYFRTQDALMHGQFPAAQLTICFVAVVVFALIVVVFGVLIAS